MTDPMPHQPHAVDVFLEDTDEKTLKNFHCSSCGFIVFQYFSRLRIIIPGTTISHHDFNQLKKSGRLQEEIDKQAFITKAPIVVQCNNRSCRLRYNIR